MEHDKSTIEEPQGTTAAPAKKPRRERNHALMAQIGEELMKRAQERELARKDAPRPGDSLRTLRFSAPEPDYARATFAPPPTKKKSGAAYKRVREAKAAAAEAERQRLLDFINERKRERAESAKAK
jgi:hypothetical protein